MIKLYDQSSGALLGEVSEAQFQVLLDQLEEESLDDQDYYLNRATLDYLQQAGADPALLAVLNQALGDREDMDIRWARS